MIACSFCPPVPASRPREWLSRRISIDRRFHQECQWSSAEMQNDINMANGSVRGKVIKALNILCLENISAQILILHH